MEHLFFAINIAGSIVSILMIFPKNSTKTRVIHITYVVLFLLIGTSWNSYRSEIMEIKRIEYQANKLLNDEHEYSSLGFIFASLSFLEKHKEKLPSTYKRAVKLCNNNKCLDSNNSKSSIESYHHSLDIIDVSSAMKGLIRGLSYIH